MWSRYASGAVEVRLWCGRAVKVRSWYGLSAVEVRSWYGRGTLVVRSRYACGAVEVHSWCTSGSLPVRQLFNGRYCIHVHVSIFTTSLGDLRYGGHKNSCFVFYKDGVYSCNGNGTVGTRHGPFNGELNGPFNG